MRSGVFCAAGRGVRGLGRDGKGVTSRVGF